MEFNACPECNRPVNVQTSNCIHCGHPLAMKAAKGASAEPAGQFAATTPIRVPKAVTEAVSQPAVQFVATVPVQVDVKAAAKSAPDDFLATTPMRRIEAIATVPVVLPTKASATRPQQPGNRSPAARLIHRLLKRDENT